MSEDLDVSGSPRERTTYSTFSDDYRGFDAREEEGGGKGLLVAALAVGVVLVFGTVVWNAYRAGTKKDPSHTPVLSAEKGGFKSKPEDRGGMQVPNQDKRLFDAIDENDRDATVEKTSTAGTTTSPGDGKPKDLRPSTTISETEDKPAVKPEVIASKPIAQPSPVPTPVAPVYEEPSLPIERFDPTGTYLVQLAALRDVGAAETAWSQMVESYPDLFGGAHMDIQRADLGAKGIFYRVRVSAFSSRADADAFCEALKSRGESCMVTTR